MPRAKLSIRMPEMAWIARLSRRHPEARFRVLAAISVDEGGAGLLQITAEDPGRIAAEVGEFDTVTSVDRLETSDDVAIVEFRTGTPMLLLSAREAGLPLRPPVDIQAGVASVWVTGSAERLSAFAERLEQYGMALEVEKVTSDVDPSSLLTDRQREVVEAAIELGYYDTPRRCSMGELANALGVAQSTCSETLHRAEGAIVRAFVEELPAIDVR